MCRARLRAALLPLLVAACALLSVQPNIAQAEVVPDSGLRLSSDISLDKPGSISGPLPQGAVSPAPALQGGALPVEDDLPRIATIDLTTPSKDLWQRIRNGFAMPNLESPLVAERQAWYLNHPAALKVMVQRSRRYLYHIVTELEKRGMPTELALLPMVESAYNPQARSPARALGMWQFIPSTGRNYNLAQNWWLDERRDIIASTNAALDYLQNIYEMNGDWHLALASYNWGENAVAKAVARNLAKGLPTDYQSIGMPGETRYYVPKLQALKNIIADPALFGFALDPIPNKPYFEKVDMPASMDVATAAKLAEIPLDEFMALNPAYNRPLMPDNGNTALVLPADRISVFQTNLVRHERQDKPLSLWKTTVLKPKEKLDAVAARYGISTARLKQFNSIGPRTKVKPGLTLLVPASPAAAQEIAANMPQPPAEEPPAARSSGHASAKSRHAGRGASKHDIGKAHGKGRAAPARVKGSGGTKPTKPQGKAAASKGKGKKH
ncbi:MAG TPA: transglycosylase SLT domain-containing protein [Rhodocyclaceae bacterium]|nr:transglycosylase SLT domain-containing protein [Rhodocyclaceae bacterium]